MLLGRLDSDRALRGGGAAQLLERATPAALLQEDPGDVEPALLVERVELDPMLEQSKGVVGLALLARLGGEEVDAAEARARGGARGGRRPSPRSGGRASSSPV